MQCNVTPFQLGLKIKETLRLCSLDGVDLEFAAKYYAYNMYMYLGLFLLRLDINIFAANFIGYKPLVQGDTWTQKAAWSFMSTI